MIIENVNARRGGSAHDDVSPWQMMVLVICMVASIASGVGAFAYLSATHPVPNRLSWSLEPPKRAKAPGYLAAPVNLQAGTVQRGHVREM